MSAVAATAKPSFRRWCAGNGTAGQATEFIQEPRSAQEFAAALALVNSDLEDSSFVILKVLPSSVGWLVDAVDSYRRLDSKRRLCLAAKRSVLATIETRKLDLRDVAFLLDDVDLDMSFANLVLSPVTAIRFTSGFLLSATQELRCGYALEAILGLAADLGLTTFASVETPCMHESMATQPSFDYILSPEFSPPINAQIRNVSALLKLPETRVR